MTNTIDLHFDVTKQAIKRTDEEFIAAGAINTLIANFDFCETWSGLYKFCRFEGGGSVVDVRIEDDKCVIPWEVLEFPGFTMACYGTRSTDVMLTTAKLPVKVFQSVNFIVNEPLPPTPQLVEYYNNLANNDLSDLATQTQLDTAINAEAQARQAADNALAELIPTPLLESAGFSSIQAGTYQGNLNVNANQSSIKLVQVQFPTPFTTDNPFVIICDQSRTYTSDFGEEINPSRVKPVEITKNGFQLAFDVDVDETHVTSWTFRAKVRWIAFE